MLKPLSQKLTEVPSNSGVYLMKDKSDEIIYVGKAGNLKKRVASYFTGKFDNKTKALVEKIVTFETIITSTENEALILESNLIKKHKPRYNVVLKDDKRYLSLRINLKESYPPLSFVRKIKDDGALYFGPFSSASALRKTVKIIDKTFKIRKCKIKNFRTRSRPCINYQMDTCLGPCCHEIDKNTYMEIIREVSLFLNGRALDLIKKIKEEMIFAANQHEYEKAAQLRDKMFAIEKVIEKQIAVSKDRFDRDIIGIAGSSDYFVITLLFVRSGFLGGMHHFSFSETISTEAERVETFVKQYYEKSHFIPEEIIVPTALENSDLIESYLGELKEKKVKIINPKRGEKVKLIQMALENAQNELASQLSLHSAIRDILIRLKVRLRMEAVPVKIECFDNSALFGTSPVAGMVVYINGRPHKASYRKYKIRTVTQPDDYAYMAEVLERRFKRKEDGFPDLLMVDGGRGQLSMAVAVQKDLNLQGKFEIISIAKKDENRAEKNDKIYKPGRANPVNFGKEEDLLRFLEQIRDEAHRFAISFHRKRRAKTSMQSVLDEIPGIGTKRKEILFRHFKGIQKIRAATLEELSELPGMNIKVAKAIHEYLR